MLSGVRFRPPLIGSDAGMRQVVAKRPASAAGLDEGAVGDRSQRSAYHGQAPAAALTRQPQMVPPPPPNTNGNSLQDMSMRVMVFTAADDSKISGDAITEDYMTRLNERVDEVATCH